MNTKGCLYTFLVMVCRILWQQAQFLPILLGIVRALSFLCVQKTVGKGGRPGCLTNLFILDKYLLILDKYVFNCLISTTSLRYNALPKYSGVLKKRTEGWANKSIYVYVIFSTKETKDQFWILHWLAPYTLAKYFFQWQETAFTH